MSETASIAVVGGGPAGATCARALARAGARVTLFESSPSAEKPCGGGVPAAALREFPELAEGSLARRVAREVLIFSPSDRRVRISLTGGIHIFRRLEVDSHLRRRAGEAGAAIRHAKVKAVRELPGGRWELLTEEGTAGPFDRLVAADGVRGAVRRALAGPFRDDQLTLALYAYVEGVAREEIVLKFFGDLDGYLWAFPRTDHVSLGICATHRKAEPARLEEALRRFMDRFYPEGRLHAGALRGYFIPASLEPAGRARRSQGGRTWALAGDAAGFADPLTREGISWAMRSGRALALRLIGAGRAVTPELPGDLRWAHRHARGFYRRDFLESMTRLAAVSSAIRSVLADLFSGHQGYRGLKARLLLNALPCGLEVGLEALAAVAGGGGRGAASR